MKRGPASPFLLLPDPNERSREGDTKPFLDAAVRGLIHPAQFGAGLISANDIQLSRRMSVGGCACPTVEHPETGTEYPGSYLRC
jgi:hypothetical protein